MGSYEILVKTEEIRKNVVEGDLLSAQEILDTVELRKVKNLSDLNLMAGVLKENGRYDEAAELYLRIYNKSKTRKTIAQLLEISIKRDIIEDALKYFSLYDKYAKEDYESHIFRYKLDKMQGASYEVLIQSLEKLKEYEYSEKWAYELAKLYYKADMEDACVKECSDIILWFGEGIYVEKAKLLRSYYVNGTNKEKIMEELKRRAGAVQGQAQEQVQVQVQGRGQVQEQVQVQDQVQVQEQEQVQVQVQGQEQGQAQVQEQAQEQTQGIKEEAEDTQAWLRKELAKAVEPMQFTEDIEPQGYYASQEDSNQQQEDLYEEVAIALDEELLREAESEPEDTLEEDEGFPQGNHEEVVPVKESLVYVFDLEEESQEDNVLDYIGKTTGIKLEEIFNEFLEKDLVKLQLMDTLVNLIQGKMRPVLLTITGTNPVDNINLAKDLALFMNKAGKLSSPKVAKITGSKLNTINIMSKKEMLKGCCLLIENTGELKAEVLKEVLRLAQLIQEDFSVIFIEDKKDSKELIGQYPFLVNKIMNHIHL